jgi:hypothetical protein
MGRLQRRRSSPLKRLSTGLGSLFRNPVSVLSNPYTAWTSLLAMFGALFADALGQGYVWVLGVAGLLFIIGIVNELRKVNIYQHEAIPLPIVINIANPASSDNALNCLFNIIEKDPRYYNHRQHLAQYLTLKASDLVFQYSGDIHHPEMLRDFLKITRHNLEKLKGKTPKNTTLYLAYIGPASVGVLVGTMLGTDSVKIFQYSKSSDSYYEAIHIEDRRLKESVSDFEMFTITRKPETKRHSKVTVALDIASHKIKLSEPSIQAYGDLIYMASRSNGTIAASDDWLRYCQEIFTVLNSAQQTYDEIRLIYSMPVALSVALGCALQTYWQIMLTNYDSTTNTYKDLMRMNDLRYYF